MNASKWQFQFTPSKKFPLLPHALPFTSCFLYIFLLFVLKEMLDCGFVLILTPVPQQSIVDREPLYYTIEVQKSERVSSLNVQYNNIMKFDSGNLNIS